MVKKFMIEQETLEPIVSMVASNSRIELMVCYVLDCKRRRPTKELLFSNILAAFEAAGGKVSLASTPFRLVDPSVLTVRLTDAKDSARKAYR